MGATKPTATPTELVAARDAFDRWVNSTAFDELDVIETAGGRLLFPAAIYVRKARGKLEERRCCIQVLREIPDKAKARVKAREWAAKLGLDVKPGGADEDKLEGFETICQIARAIRSCEPPYEQLEEPEDLVAHYDDSSLMAVWDLHSQYEAELNPRPPAVDDETVCRIAIAMRKKGTLRPLAAIDGRAQHTCVLRLGSILGGYLTQSSSDAGQEISTPD